MYIPPNNSSGQSESQETENLDIFSTLLDEVAKFSCKGDIMFIGDLNARTGNLEKTLINDFDLLEDITFLKQTLNILLHVHLKE